MTDSDDKLSRHYRSLAHEEPSRALDSAILAAARARAGRSRMQRWAGPLSIAAVLVLGIGVSLRMQMEQPGIETSMPATEAPPTRAPEAKRDATTRDGAMRDESRQDASPSAPVPAQQGAPAPMPTRTKDAPVQKAKATPAEDLKERAAAAPGAEANVAQPAPIPAPSAATAGHLSSDELRPQAPAAMSAPPPAAFAPVRPAAEPAQAPMRARDKAESDAGAASSGAGARDLRKSLATETDFLRELERIAKLRESGDHAAADRALGEFRRNHPDFRIPEALWERVRPP